MVGVGTQQVELFLGGLENDQVVVFGVLGDFQSALRNGPVVEQSVGAIQLDLGQFLVLDA